MNDNRNNGEGCVRTMIERPFRVKSLSTGKELPEATGWAMDAAARGALNLVGTVIGSAILRLALTSVGCEETAEECEESVYGLKPSSLLTTVTSIFVVAAALVMPIVGAVVDRTRHRRTVGALSAFVVLSITAGQIAINRNNWFTILILEGIGGFFLLVHVTAVFAYLPDLSLVEKDLVHFTTGFNVRQFIAQVLTNVVVVGIGFTLRTDDKATNAIQTARLAAGVTVIVSGFLMFYSWVWLFSTREPLTPTTATTTTATTSTATTPATTRTGNRTQHKSLWLVGFYQVYETTIEIWTRYHHLRWFMMALLFSPDSGTGIIYAIATTFLTSFVGMDTLQVAVVSLLILVSHIGGSWVSKFACAKLNPLNSFRLVLFLYGVVVVVTGAVTTGPESVNAVYILTLFWGICSGWLAPTQRVLYCTLTPRGQEMEFMGHFAFFGNVLSWLPPLIFTLLNQGNVSMRWGITVITWFLWIALGFVMLVGDYQKAVQQVRSQPGTNNDDAETPVSSAMFQDSNHVADNDKENGESNVEEPQDTDRDDNDVPQGSNENRETFTDEERGS